MSAAQRSIVICGGAFAGLALAVALRQGLGADIGIIVADPALGTRPSRDPRATAIVAACRRLFETLGAWDAVAEKAQPILDMVVTDSRLEDATRPVFLTFAGDVEPGEPFAHMVENRHLIDALTKRAEAEGIDLRPTAVHHDRMNPAVAQKCHVGGELTPQGVVGHRVAAVFDDDDLAVQLGQPRQSLGQDLSLQLGG